MESAIKNALGVSTVSKEIECADRIIVDETGIYEAVVVSARPSDFFFLYFEVELFS